MADKKHTIWATGRRKTAIARVRLAPGDGTITINERTLENYFPRDTARMLVMQPLEVTETAGQYEIVVNVKGGGAAAPPPFTFTIISYCPAVSVTSRGCITSIRAVGRGKYVSRVRSLIVMLPVPGAIRTRAIAVLRLPVAQMVCFLSAICVLEPYALIACGFCALWGCSAPG